MLPSKAGLVVTAVLAASIAATLGGCGSDNSTGLTEKQNQTSSRLGDILKRTGGQWDKLTEDEKKFVINDVANGNERAARTMLAVRAGAAPAGPGGAPKGGPSGPPTSH